MVIPYANATSDLRARDEIKKILRRFGCESVGFMDDFERHEVLLAFIHRGPVDPTPGLGEGLGSDATQRLIFESSR